jgi:hypothetical protein
LDKDKNCLEADISFFWVSALLFDKKVPERVIHCGVGARGYVE